MAQSVVIIGESLKSDEARHRVGTGRMVGLCLVFLCNAGLGAAQSALSVCDQAAMVAAQNSNVPVEILLAVTRVETGRNLDAQMQPWPWTVNLNGKGHWFDDVDQAMAFAEGQLALGVENFDVGCFQINLRWHGTKFDSLTDVFDPQTNATYAAQFLSDLRSEKGDWTQAVKAYHSRTPELAARYVQKVKIMLADLSPIAADPYSTPVTAIAHPNRFPLLLSGVSAGAGSIVPIMDAISPLIGGVQ